MEPTKANIDKEDQAQVTTTNGQANAWFHKYFLDGQKYECGVVHAADPDATFYQKHRKIIALLIPAIVVHIAWWTIAIINDNFHLFTETSGSKESPNWIMSITMVFGSLVAGSTSEGGAAVAFPVMTLALGISPKIARDFSFMIQSVGMTASSYTILSMRVKVEWNALKWVTLGGVAGIIFGLEQIAPRLAPAFAKMYFVVIWSSFAVGLYLLNRNWDRKVYNDVQNLEEAVLWRAPGASLGKYVHFNWKLFTLLMFGFVGGIFSSVAGSGIDICSFACLTLLFRICEKVATPTSVVLMAINTCVGFAYREWGMGGVASEAWPIFFVCVPIVVFGAPIGSFLGSYLHRLTLAGIIYFIDTIQLIGALVIVQPWTTKKTEEPLILTTTSAAIFLGGMISFATLSHTGLKLSQAEGGNDASGLKEINR